jgi:hypothetical protein
VTQQAAGLMLKAEWQLHYSIQELQVLDMHFGCMIAKSSKNHEGAETT